MGPPKEIWTLCKFYPVFQSMIGGFLHHKRYQKKQMQISYDLLFFSCLTWWSLVQYLVIEKWVLFFPLLLQLKAIETGVILLIVYMKIFVFRKSPWSNSICTMQHIKFVERFSKLIQLNLHEIDLSYRYLSHHLTWHCLLISGFLPVLVCCDHKIVLHWMKI